VAQLAPIVHICQSCEPRSTYHQYTGPEDGRSGWQPHELKFKYLWKHSKQEAVVLPQSSIVRVTPSTSQMWMIVRYSEIDTSLSRIVVPPVIVSIAVDSGRGDEISGDRLVDSAIAAQVIA
jgi:hypothetical protein